MKINSGKVFVMMSKVSVVFTALSLVMIAGAQGQPPVVYERDIQPLFEDRCYDCHGPDKQKAQLRLDKRVSLLQGGDSGFAAMVPGRPEESFLLEAVKGVDPDAIMPPKGDPLTKAQIDLLERWIAEGGQWPGQMDDVVEVTTDLWSLQPVERSEVPVVKEARTPIDAFLLEALKEKNLGFSSEADARSLIRRASILLTGFPPTPERVTAFSKAHAENADAAYGELVEELLASPHFGERWAQHWLDVIRWAETNGSEANLYRKNAWIYRDYVVRAFNEDIPYDQFIREQLAGDQLGVGDATGFLVAGPHVPAATVGREPSAIRQARADRMDEVVQTVGASMLGMTVSCARCHNHKFDPISIQDYYSLTAVFQGVEFGGRYPEYSPEHPLKVRAKELRNQLWQHRQVLGQGNQFWEEDWGAFRELHFKPVTVKEMRVHFVGGWGRLDELELLGPVSAGNENYALSSEGTTITEGSNTINEASPPALIIDGEYGTMGWSIKKLKDTRERPWVELTFSEEREIGRIRLSSNREYYFDTDYLDKNGGHNIGDFAIQVKDENGSWKIIAGSAAAKKNLASKPDRKAAGAGVQEMIALLAEEGPRTSFVGRFKKPGPTYVLHRGSPESPRGEVPPAGFAIIEGDLGIDGNVTDKQRRKLFAEWISRPEHPLTARVMVNRVWHHVFGTGIVSTTADFGVAGAPPSHPALLDYLAAEWVKPSAAEATPWSMKDLIRQMVLTDAFRQSSAPDEAGLDADAGARYLWRFPPRRMEAEVIRDGILQASGKLDPRIGGKSYRIHNVKKTYAQWEVVNNHGPETWRRMLYQERMRRVDDQIFTAFDFPDCGQVRAKRPVSTTPLQALNLMNSPFAMEQSTFIAERALHEANNDSAQALNRVFELLLGRLPSAEEREACRTVVKESGLQTVCRSIINTNEFAFLP
jgi:mono/diheme cytochrome c family protein